MDVFKQNRYLVVVTIILVLLNVTIITLSLTAKPESKPQFQQDPPGPRQVRMILKKELGFTASQTEKYMELRRELRGKVQSINKEKRAIKKQMFDMALKTDAPQELSDSLLNLVQTKQAEIEKLTYRHMRSLNQLCTPEQQGDLKHLLRGLLRPGPPGRRQGPPPHR
ncbi:MAG: hypothetical protein HQK83_02860 [Fibrobacteria bacterium]|nr:hypothetical protein [Fibrobacteria bacterium]